MTSIDWSKAPDWAEACGRVHCVTSHLIWFNDTVYMYLGDTRSYPWATSETEVMYNHSRKRVTDVVSRPVDWSGEGLPPVGTVCEWHPNVHGWVEVTILGHHGEDTWYIAKGEEHSQTCQNMAFFRPIRTAEQIAAEEREKAIDEMAGWAGVTGLDLDIERRILGRLYDGGYRKQVQP